LDLFKLRFKCEPQRGENESRRARFDSNNSFFALVARGKREPQRGENESRRTRFDSNNSFFALVARGREKENIIKDEIMK